ncbi:MAG: urease accessory protein [Cellvibrionaceae bacterium]|jgi:urease accessory protein
MEAIVYHGASTALQTTIDLSAGSKFSGWEITCFGLPASGQLFESGSFQQSYRIEREGTPIFIDRLQVNATDHALLKGFADMQGFTVSGFIIAGSFEDILLETLIDSLREKVHGLNIQKTVSITQLEDFLVVRYLGDSAFQC